MHNRTTALETVSARGSSLFSAASCGIAFLLPLVFWPEWAQPFSTAKIWLLGVWVAAGLAYSLVSGMIRKPLPSGAAWSLGIWIAATSLSSILADDPSLHELALGLLAASSFALVFWTKVPPRKFAGALVSSGTIVALIALLQYFGADPFLLLDMEGSLQGSSRIRIFSTLGNPNFVAAVLTAILPISVCMPRAHGLRAAAWHLARRTAALMQAGAILATGSRSPVIGLAACGVWLLYRSRKLNAGWLCAGGAVCLLTIILSPARPLESTIAGRFYIWRVVGAQILRISPSGFGPGAFPVYYPKWEAEYLSGKPDPDRTFSGPQEHAHNDYLEFLVDYGIVGLMSFFLMLGMSWQVLRRGRPGDQPGRMLENGFGASIVALLAIALVDFPLHRPTELYLFWTQLALLWILKNEACELAENKGLLKEE